MFPVATSILASFVSGITILGYTSEMYMYGTMAWISPIGNGLGAVVAALIFIPLLYPLKITSSYEVYWKP